MDWFKTTSGFWSHPKVAGLTDRAFRTIVSAWGYAAQHNTEGHITPAALRLLSGRPADARALVDAGLLVPNGDGWHIHDWDDHQAAAVAWHDKRRRDREAAAERRRRAKEDTDAP